MSTWLYLVCQDHNPPIVADDESGQHLYDLPQIRADVADRASVVEQYWAGEFDRTDGHDLDYFRRHTGRFLSAHRECAIGIRDEYGRDHSLTEADE